MVSQSPVEALETWRLQPSRPPGLPTVDVIVPFRNEARLLPDKLTNLLCLDYPGSHLRFVLVDGQSTDGSREMAEQAARSDARFVVLRCRAADKTQQINLALTACTAPWVLITDVDAYLPPNTLKELLVVATVDPRVAVTGVFHRPQTATCLDRLHWQMWNVSRRFECRLGSASAVLGPCYLLRGGWLSGLPADVVADDMYVSFAALAGGWRIALADTLVVERRAPAGSLAFLFHKVRKGRAFLREVLRFLPAAPRMPSPMRELFLWRAAATLLAPPVILGAAAAGLVFAPKVFAVFWAFVLVCCCAPLKPLAPWSFGRLVVTAAALVGLWVVLAGVLCVALASLPFFAQQASFSRWRQEEE
jgi:cellulose synthase/poly-beta-1,6-N-acetylglucosamine synthase-like glycosyltransferase